MVRKLGHGSLPINCVLAKWRNFQKSELLLYCSREKRENVPSERSGDPTSKCVAAENLYGRKRRLSLSLSLSLTCYLFHRKSPSVRSPNERVLPRANIDWQSVKAPSFLPPPSSPVIFLSSAFSIRNCSRRARLFHMEEEQKPLSRPGRRRRRGGLQQSKTNQAKGER